MCREKYTFFSVSVVYIFTYKLAEFVAHEWIKRWCRLIKYEHICITRQHSGKHEFYFHSIRKRTIRLFHVKLSVWKNCKLITIFSKPIFRKIFKKYFAYIFNVFDCPLRKIVLSGSGISDPVFYISIIFFFFI